MSRLVTINSLTQVAKLFQQAVAQAGPQHINTVLKKNPRFLMAYFDSGATDWHRFVYPSQQSYSKVWVGEKQGPIDVAVITWLPAQQTGIHDHPENGCLMMPLIGSLNENRYVSHPSLANQYSLSSSRILVPGDIAYIDNKLGAHKVRNTSGKLAVSLHVYCDGLN